ncbi:MAG: hypothetical protein R6T91_00630 [Bacteroidales bacterium]
MLWYSTNKRNIPWRISNDPFKVWLSEIILQQTRVDQIMDYYNHFVSEFKSIQALANAPGNKIMRMWQGLGYYSRARNLLDNYAIPRLIEQYMQEDFQNLS